MYSRVTQRILMSSCVFCVRRSRKKNLRCSVQCSKKLRQSLRLMRIIFSFRGGPSVDVLQHWTVLYCRNVCLSDSRPNGVMRSFVECPKESSDQDVPTPNSVI